MEEKNELSDIMLDKKENKLANTKKILLLTIVLIILFLLALVAMRILNKSENKKNSFDLTLPPEPSAKVEKTKIKDELFKQVPIIEENDTQKSNFDAMVEKLKQKEKSSEQETKNKTQPETKIQNNQEKKSVSSKTKKNVKKETKKPTKNRKKLYTHIKNKVYIQVGVTFKAKPNQKFLNKIKRSGYDYTLYSLKIGGKKATKILIGPYKNKKIARKSIAKIKRSINKAAFIYVIK